MPIAVYLFLLAPFLALPRTVHDGVYSKAQAERGQVAYTQECATCHGDAMKGGEAPELIGPEFVGRWKSNTVGALFQFIRKTMPSDNPGHLTTGEYAELTAFLLSSNGFPAGEKDLEDKVEVLNDIHFDSKP
jgi:S-disulfanyl-L-cysteine oxidoreductase SoxD